MEKIACIWYVNIKRHIHMHAWAHLRLYHDAQGSCSQLCAWGRAKGASKMEKRVGVGHAELSMTLISKRSTPFSGLRKGREDL